MDVHRHSYYQVPYSMLPELNQHQQMVQMHLQQQRAPPIQQWQMQQQLENMPSIQGGKERALVFLSNLIPSSNADYFLGLIPQIKPLMMYAFNNEPQSSYQPSHIPGISPPYNSSHVALNHHGNDATSTTTTTSHSVLNKPSSTSDKASLDSMNDEDDDNNNNDSKYSGWKSACNICAKSKVRCVRYNNNDKCERCLHVGYDCVYSRKRKRERNYYHNQ